MKHTPGPWKYDEIFGLIMSADGHEVAACHAGRTGEKPETTDNARLIAAAPEMLGILKELCQDAENDLNPNHISRVMVKIQNIVKASNIISKVEGGERE